MNKQMIVAGLFACGLVTGCTEQNEPAEIEVTVEEPDTIAEDLEDAGEALQENADEAGDRIEDAAEDAEAAMNEAGEAMTETTDTPE